MAELDRENLFPDLPEVRSRFEQLLNLLSSAEGGAMSEAGVWHPPVDIEENQESVVCRLDLPGMKGQEVDVSIEENHLYIEGRRETTEEPAEGALYYRERPTGGFHRIIHLPADVDAEGTEANYDDGVLTVTMPKIERERGRRIEIR